MLRSNMLIRSASLLAVLGAGMASGCTLGGESNESAFAGYDETGDEGADTNADDGADDEAGVGETAFGTFGDGPGELSIPYSCVVVGAEVIVADDGTLRALLPGDAIPEVLT